MHQPLGDTMKRRDFWRNFGLLYGGLPDIATSSGVINWQR